MNSDSAERSARSAEHQRFFDAPPERLYAAIVDPQQLTRWWGPAGFRSSFDIFEPRPRGRWIFTLHGPDGRDYPNENLFVELVPARRVVIHHLAAEHHFEMTLTLTPEGSGTRLDWQQTFDSPAHYERVRELVTPANEQNLDRLQAHLAADVAADRAAEAAGQRLLEVRAYQLSPGTRESFHAAVAGAAAPMLRDWCTDVVAFGPIANESDGYQLLRAYRDLADLEARQAQFYGSGGWRQGPREAIVGAIQHYTSSVLWLSPASLADLRARNAGAA